MRKVKNFRVNLRAKEISRLLKGFINTAELAEEIEKSIPQYCYFYCKFIVPSLVYETFSKDVFLFDCSEDVPPKWIAKSVFFVTLGNNLYEEYEKNKEAFGEYTEKIVSAIATGALEESKKFARKLILNEAREENCELSENLSISKDLCESAANNIPINKIGMSVESGKLNPCYSSCGLFYWVPLKKTRK